MTTAPNSSVLRSLVYVLGDNIDTDQILTAEYLKINPATDEGRNALAKLAMCGLPEGSLPFLDSNGSTPYHIIVAGENFGCGSSREHAVVALGAAGVRVVLAQSFARIFFRNCIATGQILPVVSSDRLCDAIATDEEVEILFDERKARVVGKNVMSSIEPVEELANVVAAGGMFAYARSIGKIKPKSNE